MANVFNSFYSDLGSSIEQKIPKSQKSYSSYLNTPINSTFNATLCTETEIAAIISNFGIKKASGPNSFPTNILKEFSAQLTYPLLCRRGNMWKDFVLVFSPAHHLAAHYLVHVICRCLLLVHSPTCLCHTKVNITIAHMTDQTPAYWQNATDSVLPVAWGLFQPSLQKCQGEYPL